MPKLPFRLPKSVALTMLSGTGEKRLVFPPFISPTLRLPDPPLIVRSPPSRGEELSMCLPPLTSQWYVPSDRPVLIVKLPLVSVVKLKFCGDPLTQRVRVPVTKG